MKIKRFTNRIFALILSISVLLSLVPQYVRADDSVSDTQFIEETSTSDTSEDIIIEETDIPEETVMAGEEETTDLIEIHEETAVAEETQETVSEETSPSIPEEAENTAQMAEPETTSHENVEPETTASDGVANVISDTVRTSDNFKYIITVNYDASAGIPADAKLRVNEVTAATAGIDEKDIKGYIDQSAEALKLSLEEMSSVRLFDIALIGSDGAEYQPNEKVSVSIELLGKDNETEDMRIVHFGEEPEELTAEVEGNTVTFETEGFSLFSLVDVTVLQRVINAVLGKNDNTLYENDDIILTGKMPVLGSVEATPVTVEIDGVDVLVAYDIKIYANPVFKALGITWQPTDGAIQVQVKSEALGGVESVSVYHMTDENSRPEFVTEANVIDSCVSFDAESFSIYPIGEGTGNERIGYRFWYYNGTSEKYEEITTQYFRYSDVQTTGMRIYEPGIPGISQSDLVKIFEGWHKGTVTNGEATLGESVTIEGLNTELSGFTSDEFIEGTIIDIIAQLKDAYYISYVDINTNSVIGTDLVIKEESGETTFIVKEGIKPTRYEEDLKGWRLLEDIADDTATLYIGGLQYPITSNITLAPVIEGGYWLVFDDNDLIDDGAGKMVSGGASYTPPNFYMNNVSEQQTTIQPADPEWTGYEFSGWYEDEACTTEFEFGGLLTANTTVHAKWIPSNTYYTVIIWKQPTDPNATAYDFDQSFTITENVKTGDLVYLDPSYTQLYGEDGTSTDLNKQYFTYNQEKTDQYIIAKANGSSVFNVYYDRVPMIIDFYTWGYGYTYTETDSDEGTQYGIVNGQYVELSHIDGEEDVYSYTYSPEYIVAPDNLSSNYTQYGIINGTYQPLVPVASYSFSYNAFNPTTGTDGTQYALVDGEYVRLTRVPVYEYYALTSTLITGNDYLIVSSNSSGTGYALGHSGTSVVSDQVTVNSGTAATNNTLFINASDVDSTSVWTVGNGYTFKNGNYYLTNGSALNRTLSINTSSSNWTWNSNNNRLYYDGFTDRYIRYNNGFSLSTTPYSIYLYHKVVQYAWQYTRDGETVTLSDSDTRYVQSGIATSYNGQRYIRSGSNWWEYSYSETDEESTGLFGVDSRGGHVALSRSASASSYSYYYNGEEYTGTRYYFQNNNPVDYSGTIYTLDDGVYHVTTEGSVSDRYGMDENGVFRSLTGSVSHPKLWTYVDSNGETQFYTGTRYTRSANQSNSWQLYKQFVGVYGATLEQYGYEWPMEYNWYEYGGRIADGGNADSYISSGRTYNLSSGGTGGSRMTLKTTFEPLSGNLHEKYYGSTPSTSGRMIRFWVQNESQTDYVLKDTIYSGSSGTSASFHINDKYTGFHAVSYSTNGGTTWINVTPKGEDGYYGNAVSYTSTIDIRFNRNYYDLVFFPDPDTSASPITYSLPYEADISSYASQSPGQKLGYYFLGWYADDARTQLFDFDGSMPDHNVSVFGYWRMERIRAVFVPGADNVYIDPSQALSFRVDYDDKIGGSFFESATRTGYILDGWYTDPNFTNKFLFSTPINSSVEGVDMTYQTSSRWTSTRVSYGDDDEEHSNVRGILVLYAKWIINTSEKGVNIVYDAGPAALYDGMNNLTTTVPIDPRLYQEGSSVVVGAAPSGYSDLYYFDYWEIVDSNGNVVTITNSEGDSISSFYPGATFNVSDVSDEDAFSLTLDENGEVIIKTIKLRAHYTKSEEAAARYTTITYDGDTMEESVYPSGTKEIHGKALDGSERYSVTLDKEINATIILPNETDFYLDGYTLIGWSFFEGTYDEQIAAAADWNAEHPDLALPLQLQPAAEVAADNLTQSTVNDESNTLYAMWQPKTYTVTIKQVIESGVEAYKNYFDYTYKSGVENALGNAGNITFRLNGNDSNTYEYLTSNSSVKYQYYERLGHVFNITTPVIAETEEYAVRVSATVLKDDGSIETLQLNDLGNYEILGDVTITYTYSLKVPVKLEKKALDSGSDLTGSKFLLTPVEWNSDTQRWVQIGTATFEYDMSSVSSLTKRLQEGIYRVEETQAPANYAMMGEPILLTVQKDSAFTIRTTTGGTVKDNIARITGTDSHALTIYDRPIRDVIISKIVDGDDFEPNGYLFSVQIILEGSPVKQYDTVGNGQSADITNSTGIIEFRVKNGENKTLHIPWGAVVTVTESEYKQYTVKTEGVKCEDTVTTDEDNRIFGFTLDVNCEVRYTNIKKLPAPTGISTDFKPYGWMLLLGGLLAMLALPIYRKRKRDDDPGGGYSRAESEKPQMAKDPPESVPTHQSDIAKMAGPPEIKGRARPRGDTGRDSCRGPGVLLFHIQWRHSLWRGSGPGDWIRRKVTLWRASTDKGKLRLWPIKIKLLRMITLIKALNTSADDRYKNLSIT